MSLLSVEMYGFVIYVMVFYAVDQACLKICDSVFCTIFHNFLRSSDDDPKCFG